MRLLDLSNWLAGSSETAPGRAPKTEVPTVHKDRLSLEEPDVDGPGLDEPNFDNDDDSELDPIGEPWDPLVLEDDEEEPEPEYGDFWPEPDDFDD
jgi:hypothetical protein